jgi:hypothetical protein
VKSRKLIVMSAGGRDFHAAFRDLANTEARTPTPAAAPLEQQSGPVRAVRGA